MAVDLIGHGRSDNPADPAFHTVRRHGSADQISFEPGAHQKFRRRVPGSVDQAHRVIEGANHFIQDDAADELVEIIDEFTRVEHH